MQPGTLVLIGISALLVLAGTQASLNLFITDEAVYFLGADTFRLTGGFIVDNGAVRFGSVDLEWLHFLPVGPNGQTTQYPPGMSILGGWMLAAFGARGLLYLNVIATVGCLFVTRALARLLFGSDRIALAASLLFVFGTFVAEYAVAYWPHMVSVLAVNLSLLLFLKALLSGERVFALCVLSGLVLGGGLLFRIDSILLLPVIGLLSLLFVRRWQDLAGIALGGLAGLAGPVLLLSAINSHRYGTWNPLSYGPSQEGGVALTSYGPQTAVLLGLAAGLVAARGAGARVPARLWGGLLAGAVALGVLLSADVRGLFLAYGNGVLRLIVDATRIVDPRAGVVPGADGTLLFWGLPKKALGQSLPWIGILLALAGLTWRDRRRSVLVLLVLTGVWTFPFLVRSWFGGLGSNMRYFLPLLPGLAMLAAWVTARLMAESALSGRQAPRLLLTGGILGGMAALFWATRLESGLAGAHQIYSTYVFLAVAAGGLLTGYLASPGLRRIALVLTGIGLGTGVFNGITDAHMGQLRRAGGEPLTDLSAGYDGPVLVYNRLYRSALITPDQYVAVPSGPEPLPDPALVGAALDAGLRVVVPEDMGRSFTERDAAFRVDGAPHGRFPMVDIARSAER